jgi:hypothetical protein
MIIDTKNIKIDLLNLMFLINENSPINPVPQRRIELIVNVGDKTKTGIIIKSTNKNIP